MFCCIYLKIGSDVFLSIYQKRMRTDCITYAVAEGLGVKQATWSQMVCFCMRRDLISEELRLLYPAYGLGLLSFVFPEFVFNCTNDTGIYRHENVYNVLWPNNNESCYHYYHHHKYFGGEEGGVTAAFQKKSIASGFCWHFHICSALLTSASKSPWICPCWAPALLNKLDPYAFGKQDNVQWKNIYPLYNVRAVLCNEHNFLLPSSPSGRPFKTDLDVSWRGWKCFQLFSLKSGKSGPGQCSLAGLPCRASHQPVRRSSLEELRYCLLFETSSTESYFSVLNSVIKKHGLGGSPKKPVNGLGKDVFEKSIQLGFFLSGLMLFVCLFVTVTDRNSLCYIYLNGRYVLYH